MKTLLGFTLCVAGFATTSMARETNTEGVNWPGFRGPNASGISEGHALPESWDLEESQNVQWKAPIPGLGFSCPVIWENRIFLTTAVSGKEDPQLRVGLYGDIAPVEDDTVHLFNIYALDKTTGKILWEHTSHKGVPKIKRHTKASHANSTPVTDGKYLVAFYGSEGLYCYDLDGTLLWKKDLGVLDSGFYVVKDAQWGFASSPVIYKDKVLIQCDVQENSFLAAFNLKDGAEIWRTGREEVPTWSTPTIYEGKDRTQMIVNGFKHIGSYDVSTGEEIWKLVGGGDIPVPTPIIAHGHTFITNAHGRMAPMYAISLDAKGTISTDGDGKALSWLHARGGAYMQTPLAYGDLLYSCTDGGVLTCYEAKTGVRAYKKRLGGGRLGFTASPVAGDGKIYFTSETGEIFVIPTGTEFDILSRNSMDEVCMATPAISAGTLFVRTQNHLVALKNGATSKN